MCERAFEVWPVCFCLLAQIWWPSLVAGVPALLWIWNQHAQLNHLRKHQPACQNWRQSHLNFELTFCFLVIYPFFNQKRTFFFFSCWMYMCFISSRPVHHRRSCTSCPSSLHRMNCTSSPSTSALKASPGMNAAEPQPCDRARAASGTASAPQTAISIAA